MRDKGYEIHETAIAVADVEKADEVFLTNAINGIRWVRQFRNKKYFNKTVTKIYTELVQIIYE
jgi:branched-chain amino acid aminotransferase